MSGPLDDALGRLRLEGALFLRGEYSERWALADQGGVGFAGMIHPGAERVVIFHVIVAGRCWVDVGEEERHWASAGDVLVIPYGDEHTMGGIEPAEAVPVTSVVDHPPPWKQMPVVRHGGGGARTDVVCGYLYSDDPLFDPVVRALPPVFTVRPPPGPAADWVQASIDFALQDPSLVTTRLPEALLIEVLRLHLAEAPTAHSGWLAALRDPVLAPVVAAIHSSPERRWTVADLAERGSVSRSALDERFREVLGRSPIRYLTEWRMHVAKGLLSDTQATVSAVGRRVGYESEEAFSRAFKRAHGQAPSHWRDR